MAGEENQDIAGLLILKGHGLRCQRGLGWRYLRMRVWRCRRRRSKCVFFDVHARLCQKRRKL